MAGDPQEIYTVTMKHFSPRLTTPPLAAKNKEDSKKKDINQFHAPLEQTDLVRDEEKQADKAAKKIDDRLPKEKDQEEDMQQLGRGEC
ncbi:hypothetical protein GOP47_0003235 [Adiantum capillus-veneris]|uniref:Uncharacterized protein n=1 Tax=Adiantum capillus-veneris TaxID=13818 RepID=A0A9D4VC38_ADICA|nr:hypothetical protein GOP47_0003235 [Adiantum capillus-veneris]